MKKIILGVLLAPILLLAAALAFVLTNLDGLINSYRSDVEELATKQLGRQVRFGPARSSFDGGLFVEFTAVDLAGPTEGAPPLLHVESARLKVALWKAITSMGKDLQVEEFQLKGPSIRISRDAAGTWDFQDILDHLARNATPPDPEEAQKTLTDEKAYAGLRIAGLAIHDGRLEVKDDHELKRTLAVNGFSLVVSEIIPGRDASANLDFAIVDGGNTSPFHLDVAVKPIPATLDFSVLPQTAAHVTLKDLDLASWGSLVPAGVMRPASGRVSLSLRTETNRGATEAVAEGFVDVKALVLAQGKSMGQPSDLRVELDAGGNIPDVKFDVRKLDVTGPSVTLKTRVKIEEAGVGGIKDANVELRVGQLERVLAVLPPGTAALPAELVLEGPFEVDVKGDASQGRLRVDLDRAHLAWTDAMNKRAGTPLNLQVKATRNGDRIRLPEINLQLDTARLFGTASVSTRKGAPMEAAVDTGAVTLASLKGIFPPLEKALAGKGKVDGTFRLQANAADAAGKQQARAALELRGVDVKLEKTVVRGQATLAAEARPDGDTITASLDADLDGLEVKQLDDKNAPVFDKKAGFPMGAVLRVVKRPADAVVEKADVRLGKTLVQARGRADGLDKPSPVLDVKVENLDVAFDDIRAVAPAASMLPAGGHLGARVALAGNPDDLATLNVTVEDLKLVAAGNTVAGRAVVKNLADPDLDVSIPVVDLDFKQLRKLAKNDSIPRDGKLKARLAVKGRPAALASMKIDVDDLDTTVWRSNIKGHAHIQDLDRPRFDIKLVGDQLDINTILQETGGGGKKEDKPAEPEKPRENEHGLSREQRELVKRFNGSADVRVGKVLYDVYELQDVVAVARLQQGVLTFEALTFKALGGAFSASSTQLDLDEEYLGSRVSVDIKDLDMDRVLAVAANKKGVVNGRVSLKTQLSARGMTGKDLSKSLEGPLDFSSREVTLAAFNLMDGVFKKVGAVVPFVKPVGPAAAMAKQPTGLKDLAAALKFANGKVALPRPAVARTPWGDISLEGAGDWDKRINLVGALEITPDTVANMTGGKIRPKTGVKTPIRIGGTWDRPTVDGVDVDAFLKNAGIPDVAGALKDAAEEAHRQMEEAAQNAREEADRIRREAEERAMAEKQRLEEEARRRADEAKKLAEDTRKRAEEEARKQADEARRRAEEARKRAEDEARRRADEAKKKAEDEARRRTDEAKKKAEEEAKKRSDEAKKKAEEGLKSLFK